MKIVTQNLVKIYNKRAVVNEVSIEISQGEIVGWPGLGWELEHESELGERVCAWICG